MKIVAVDNFDRETVSDRLVAESVPELYAEQIAEFLNLTFGGYHDADYFKAVPDSYKLYVWEP